jgi:ribulose-5-phosphate 4-epimerase/fuculose-1-phosphate aldolase
MDAIVESASDAERRLRHQVTAATLLLHTHGILNYSGHLSARLPGRDVFVIQSVDQSRGELRPEDLLVCGLDGKVLGAPLGKRPPEEVSIHTEILKARPDVQAVAHFHHDPTTTFSLVEDVPLRPVLNHAVQWESGIPIHPDPSHVSDPDLGRALATTLGPHNGLIIRAHGEVVVAESATALLVDCIHFVENAEALYRAAALGRVKPLSSADMVQFRREYNRPHHVRKLWRYYLGQGRAGGVLPADWWPLLDAEV